jgi:hypothetical protein
VFITPFGAYCYTTMSFGLKNAGATYQRPIQACFKRQLNKNVEAYVDDEDRVWFEDRWMVASLCDE